ncbi:iron ABC transporter permease, partial [Klebsiella pneumoniae]|nr:iron ABC transporter permease [Klebsiella pneumoniae]
MITLDYRNKENVEVDSSLHNESRSASAFRSKKEARHYWILLITLIALGLLSSYGLLVYNNPVPIDSPSFIPVVKRRIVAIVAMIIAAVCH